MPFSLIPHRVFPDYRAITPELLRQNGIRLLLCDLDYTLAPRSVFEPDEGIRCWLDDCKNAGVQVMILSNNRSPERVQRFCGTLEIPFVGHAQKPATNGYRKAMAQARVSREQTAMLGDKLLTDVLGAHRSGITAWMVEPLGGPVGTWNHILHRLQQPFKSASKRRSDI